MTDTLIVVFKIIKNHFPIKPCTRQYIEVYYLASITMMLRSVRYIVSFYFIRKQTSFHGCTPIIHCMS